MDFYLVNESTEPTLTAAVMLAICDAVSWQIANDVAPAYGGVHSVYVVPCEADVPEAGIVAAIFDNADQQGVLGYHDRSPNGRPFVRVFIRPILDNGGTLTTGPLSLSVTISHEILEGIGDRSANAWADDGAGTLYAWELCDAVEGVSYDAPNGVAVSAFVTQDFFDPGSPGPWSVPADAAAGPFMTSPGGYQITAPFDPSQVSAGAVELDVGDAHPAWRLAQHRLDGARARRRGLAAA